MNGNRYFLDTIDHALHFRINYKLKLPDAIIAASALQNNAILMTEDTDFKNITELKIISPTFL